MHRFATLAFACLTAGCSSPGKPEHTQFLPESRLSVQEADLIFHRQASDGFTSPQSAAQAFMARTFSSGPSEDLLRDARFCGRFLSKRLWRRVKVATAQFQQRVVGRIARPEDAHPGGTGHKGTILSAWNTPTSFRMGGSHQTTRDYKVCDEHHTDSSAVVDVVYIWGKGTQYEGDERLTSVILVKEADRWFVDDLYTHGGLYCTPGHFDRILLR